MSVGAEVRLDLGRAERVGVGEAILCAPKSVAHLVHILDEGAAKGASLLLTRLSPAQFDALPARQRERIDYEPLSQTGYSGVVAAPAGKARVAIVAAGTSDAAVAREAARTLRFHGESAVEITDVGVAGLWRLLERIDEIRQLPVVIAVAGMEGALPTVLAGMVKSVVIGVPTSVGYGVATGGKAALYAMLSSCAPGVLVVNIDNGYGAACAALRALRLPHG
jgi:pyridinium-3,5-biscarboxylic acid mononucleotide synthase